MIGIELILRFLTAVLATEAITELVVKSEFFAPLRKWFFESDNRVLNFVHGILDCGYCFSVWAAFFSGALLFVFNNFIVDLFMVFIVIHRLSNIVHFVIDRIDSNKD